MRYVDELECASEASVDPGYSRSSKETLFIDYLALVGFDIMNADRGEEEKTFPAIVYQLIAEGSNYAEFVSECLKERLPDYGRLLWREAESLERTAREAFENGRLSDGGLVSLAYFRVLEVVYNHIVDALVLLIPYNVSTDDGYWRSILKRDHAGVRMKQGKLMVSELRDFFSQMGLKYEMYVDERRRRQLGESPWILIFAHIDSVMTESGKLALLSNNLETNLRNDGTQVEENQNAWAIPLSVKAASRFRNPPAHTTFASFDVAQDCREHVIAALCDLFGTVDENGPCEGWSKL